MIRRHRWLAILATGLTLAACGDDPAPNDNVTCDPGTLCPCQSGADCPTGEYCDPIGAVCRPEEGDADIDAGEDTAPDVAPDTPGEDTTPEVGPDTEDVGPELDVIDEHDADTGTDPIDDPIDDPIGDPVQDPEPDAPVDLCPATTDRISNPWVAYLSDETNDVNTLGVDNLWVVKLDASFRQHIPLPEPAIVTSPAWSPDGRTLAAITLGTVSGEPFVRRLWIIDVETGDYEFRRIPELSTFGNPSFSPDGTQIAIDGRASADTASRIWIYDIATGGAPTPVTSDASQSASPVWHRCGRIWFVRQITEQTAEVYSIETDGTDETQVTNTSRLLGRFGVASDAESLYYVRRTAAGAEESEVVRLSLEGDAPTASVIGDNSYSAVSLSPDDRFVAASIDRGSSLDIVVIDALGGSIQAEPVGRDADELSGVIGPIESDLVSIDFRE